MSLFIGNVPLDCTHKDLEQFLKPHLEQLQVFTFNAFKHYGKPSATAILIKPEDAQRFINRHGGISHSRAFHPTKIPLIWNGSILSIKKGNRPPETITIQTLEYQEKLRVKALEKSSKNTSSKKKTGPRSFDIAAFRCGTWGDIEGKPSFLSQYQHPPAGSFEDDGQTKGLLVFGRSAFAMILSHVLPVTSDQWDSRMDVPYQSVENVVAGRCGTQDTLTITLREAPKMSKPEAVDIFTQIENLTLHNSTNDQCSEWIGFEIIGSGWPEPSGQMDC